MTMVDYGWQGVIEDLLKESGLPSFRILVKFEEILREAFLLTQARTHVITGSLKASGDSFTDYNPDAAEWTGTIQYGGPSYGAPNDPVEYAIFEMARGGDHDFFAGLEEFEERFADVVLGELPIQRRNS